MDKKTQALVEQYARSPVSYTHLSHACLHNGSLRWINWRKMPSQTKTQTTRLISTHLVSTIPSFNGWKMSTIGLFHVSSGGAVSYTHLG